MEFGTIFTSCPRWYAAAICGREFRQFASNFRGQKTKKFSNGKKIHMQNFSLLTSEIPDLEQFKAWNLYRVSQSELLNVCKIVIAYVRSLKFCMYIFFNIWKLFCFLSAEISCKWAESASEYRGRARISPWTWSKNGSKLQKMLPEQKNRLYLLNSSF